MGNLHLFIERITQYNNFELWRMQFTIESKKKYNGLVKQIFVKM